jgi:hypothetical protein
MMSKTKGLMTMETYEQRDLVQYGTLREVATLLATKEFNVRPISASNLKNADKRVVLVIEDKKLGTSSTILCSRPVSNSLRAKEISLTQVLDFPIVEHTVGEGYATAGETYPHIVVPFVAGGEMEGVGNDAVAEAPVAEVVNLEDLIVF